MQNKKLSYFKIINKENRTNTTVKKHFYNKYCKIHILQWCK